MINFVQCIIHIIQDFIGIVIALFFFQILNFTLRKANWTLQTKDNKMVKEIYEFCNNDSKAEIQTNTR